MRTQILAVELPGGALSHETLSTVEIVLPLVSSFVVIEPSSYKAQQMERKE